MVLLWLIVLSWLIQALLAPGIGRDLRILDEGGVGSGVKPVSVVVSENASVPLVRAALLNHVHYAP